MPRVGLPIKKLISALNVPTLNFDIRISHTRTKITDKSEIMKQEISFYYIQKQFEIYTVKYFLKYKKQTEPQITFHSGIYC